jgi:hypothetical protein
MGIVAAMTKTNTKWCQKMDDGRITHELFYEVAKLQTTIGFR